jgi:GTP-binding protein LepA
MEWEPLNLVRLDVLLNAQSVDALSALIHESNAYNIGKKCVRSYANWYQDNNLTSDSSCNWRQNHARETIKALRKDVTAKCYGDISRKRKLLWKTKER